MDNRREERREREKGKIAKKGRRKDEGGKSRRGE